LAQLASDDEEVHELRPDHVAARGEGAAAGHHVDHVDPAIGALEDRGDAPETLARAVVAEVAVRLAGGK